MLRDVEVVGGLVVHGFWKAGKNIQGAPVELLDELGGGFLLHNSQFVEQVWLWRQWGRWRRIGRGRSSAGMLAAPAQSQHVLEADVRLRAAVHAVGQAQGHQACRGGQAGPLPDPSPQYAGEEGVLQVQGGVPRQAGQLFWLHLEEKGDSVLRHVWRSNISTKLQTGEE